MIKFVRDNYIFYHFTILYFKNTKIYLLEPQIACKKIFSLWTISVQYCVQLGQWISFPYNIVSSWGSDFLSVHYCVQLGQWISFPYNIVSSWGNGFF